MQMEALEAVHRESRRLPPIQKVSVALHLTCCECSMYSKIYTYMAGSDLKCDVQIWRH